MTLKQAIATLCYYGAEYMQKLINERDQGPEGMEIYLDPKIKKIEAAINRIDWKTL